MKLKISAIFPVLVGALLTFSVTALGNSAVPFSGKQLEQAQAKGQTILLQFHANWCPTCRQQKAALGTVLSEKEFSSLKAFEVDYDEETQLKKQYRITSQSTLILLKGRKEEARSVSVTSVDGLRDFLRKIHQ